MNLQCVWVCVCTCVCTVSGSFWEVNQIQWNSRLLSPACVGDVNVHVQCVWHMYLCACVCSTLSQTQLLTLLDATTWDWETLVFKGFQELVIGCAWVCFCVFSSYMVCHIITIWNPNIQKGCETRQSIEVGSWMNMKVNSQQSSLRKQKCQTYLLVSPSKICEFFCFISLWTGYFVVLDWWSDKAKHLKTSPLALCIFPYYLTQTYLLN